MSCTKERLSWILLLSVVVATGCSEPPPVDTTAADIQAIRALVDDFDEAINAGDYEAVAQLYSEDAIRMPAEAPPQVGQAAILEWFRTERSQYDMEIDIVVRDAQVFGDWGYSWGDASGTMTPRDGGEPRAIDSKWMAVTRRQSDGSWKTYRDIYNSNVPLPNH